MEGQRHDRGHGRCNGALALWGACVLALLGPSLLVWLVRIAGWTAGCAPGPGLCHGMALGGGMSDTLALAWGLGTHTMIVLALSVVAALAAFVARRPLLGTASLLLIPLLTVTLPALAVYTARFANCPVNTDGIGSCRLWGADMGMRFHIAASVPTIIAGLAPYAVALAFVLGILGWFLARPRPRAALHATARMRPFGED